MRTFDLVLLVVAAVCFALAAARVPTRVNLIAVGLLTWVAVPLIAAFQHLH